MIIPGYKTPVQFILLVDILQVAINKCQLNSKIFYSMIYNPQSILQIIIFHCLEQAQKNLTQF